MPENQTSRPVAGPPPLKKSNRRQFDRFTCKVDVTLESESTFYNGFAENISSGGLFVATYDVRPIGQRMKIEFTLPNHKAPIEVEGEIRWVREYNPTTPDVIPGMGVRFVGLDELQIKAIEKFTAMKEPLFYDDEL